MNASLRSSTFPFVGELFYVSKVETSFLANEIFHARIYDGDPPLELPDDAVIIDAGANVGIFSLYMLERLAGRRPTILAFEPIPTTFAALASNIRSRNADASVRLFNHGLSDTSGVATFYFYPNLAACSSIIERDAELREIAEGQDQGEILRTFYPAAYLPYKYLPFTRGLIRRAILRNVLVRESIECQLRTLSQVIADERLERIDLLKVDTERSELPILLGIAEHDWPKIRRVVVEAQDESESAKIRALLEGHGFEVQGRREIAGGTILHATRSAGAAM
jgi:FkbM family methyltransferase